MKFAACSLATCLLALGACSSTSSQSAGLKPLHMGEPHKMAQSPAAPGGTTAPLAGPAASPREQLAQAIALMGSGRGEEAGVLLRAVLAASPQDVTAQRLLRQIDADPIDLLGSPSDQPYVVQPGDTMSGLADRFLGDGLMFFALSRYNNLAAPNALVVGRTLKLPANARWPTATPAENTRSASTNPSAAASARATAIRLEALQRLNTGDVSSAVALLRNAAALDRADPAIQRDLERAERIESALH